MRENRLPHAISTRVMAFFQAYYAAVTVGDYDTFELLQNLPVALRCDVVAHVERETIARIRFLDNKTTPFVADMVMMLQRAYYRPGDLIVKEHAPATEMFFLTRGRAAVLQRGRQVFVLEEGAYFGEIGCIVDAVRNASIKALCDAEVQVLAKDRLLELLATSVRSRPHLVLARRAKAPALPQVPAGRQRAPRAGAGQGESPEGHVR